MSGADDAAEAAADAMELALMRATQSVERELTRIVKAGEDDIDRLSRKLGEILAKGAINGFLDLTLSGQQGGSGGDVAGGSMNQLAAAVARAARRGARFT